MDHSFVSKMKLWAMPCSASQDGWIMVESSDKMWSTGKGNGKPIQYSCLEDPMNSMRRQKDKTTERWTPQVGKCPICYWSREVTPERMKKQSKQKQHPVVAVICDGRKVQCCKKQYCKGTWSVRSINQGKFEMVKQEMARANLIQMTFISTTVGKNLLEEME